MGDQLRMFDIERARDSTNPIAYRDLNANELAQQLVIARKYKLQGVIKRILSEARRRNIKL